MIPGTTGTFIERGGVRLRVYSAGDGPLVLLLHGFPELAYSWRHQFAPLVAAGFRVAAPDQRGFGGSSCPAEIDAYNIEELAADAVSIINGLGGGQAVVIGHDWGAPVAWYAALRYPEAVRAVGSLSVPHARRATRRPLELLREASEPDHISYIDYFQPPGLAEGELVTDVRGALLGFMWSISGDAPREDRFRPIPRGGRFIDSFSTPPHLPGWLSEDDLNVYVDAFTYTGFRGGLNWYRNVDRNWELAARLPDGIVRQPAMFVAGTRDPARNPAAIDQLREVVPGLRVLKLLDGCGHWTQQEQPEATTRAILEFLHALDGDSRTM